MKAHQLADLLPPMSADDFEALKTSIRESGQHLPIVVYDNAILDGVNRWRACAALDIEPHIRPFDPETEGDPLKFVISMNVARRHLDVSQLAMVAGRIANLSNGGDRKSDQRLNLASDTSVAAAASLVGVARASVTHAKKVITEGTPELAKAVDSQMVSVSAAAQLVSLSHEDQLDIATEPSDSIRRRKIKDAKDKAKRQPKPEPPPTELHLVSNKAQAGTKQYYLLEDWKALSKAKRATIIADGFEATGEGMNEQTGTSIEWARWSHNTVTGCKHDCPYCYARDIADRLYPQKFEPSFHPHRLAGPGHVKVPAEASRDESYRNIFANSMSDLFGQWVPADWIDATLEMARRNPRWNFLTLTKFPQRAAEFTFPSNVWMGTTVDAQARVDNAERAFAKIKCDTKWLSLEPLLEPLRFTHLELFQWVVIGGATPSTRTPAWYPPFRWVHDLYGAAVDAGCRVYFKTNLLSDENRVREFPWVHPKAASLPKSFAYLKGMAG
jgi:protein gp37